MIWLLGCLEFPPEALTCDPRVLAPGELRARRIPCSEELISGGEGRVGDLLIENSLARYVVRGPYAALTRLGEPGGTLVDAAVPGESDMLLELTPDGDRSEVIIEEGEEEVVLRLPGLSYRLRADSPVLEIETTGADFQGIPGYERTGATLRGRGFLGADAEEVEDRGGYARMEGALRVSVDRDSLWTEPMEGEADADRILVYREEKPLLRLPIEAGAWAATLPPGVRLEGEREGCVYEGLTLVECGEVKLRLVDPQGEPLVGTLTDGHRSWPIPAGGGRLRVGPSPRRLWVWAGPAYSTAELDYPGGELQRVVTLEAAIDRGLRAQAELALEAGPDLDSSLSSYDQLVLAGARNSEFVVVLADNEVPTLPGPIRDLPLAQPGSRAGGLLWSWPWYGSPKRPAHGAVPWAGLSPLDLLSGSEGKAAERRLTVVTADWVEAALAFQEPYLWDPRPTALFLDSPGDLPAFLSLIEARVPVAPLGPTTWLGLEADRNIPAFEKAIFEGWTVAGNGPALSLAVSPRPVGGQFLVEARVEAPRWMGVQQLTLWSPAGELPLRTDASGVATTQIPVNTSWVFVTTQGQTTQDLWVGPQSWAVSGVLWLAGAG